MIEAPLSALPQPPHLEVASSDAERAPWVPPPPQRGQLTMGWRSVTVATWLGVLAGIIGIWGASRSIGLATWWLGPESQPQPLPISLLPLLAPVAISSAAFRNAKWLPLFGIGGALITAAIGLGDINRVPGLAAGQLALAGGALLVSIASFAGMYRSIAAHPPEIPIAAHEPLGSDTLIE